MRNSIEFAPNLTDILKETGEFVGVEGIPNGNVYFKKGHVMRQNVNSWEFYVHLTGQENGQGNRHGIAKRHRSVYPGQGVILLEYIAPPPNGYYPKVEEVHLIYVPSEGRKDPYPDIPFP